MANIIIDRVNIDNDLQEIRDKNDAFRQRRLQSMKEGEAHFRKVTAGVTSYKYQKQDAVIKEWVSIGRRAPQTFVQMGKGVVVFCVNCGGKNEFKEAKVSGSGRLMNWKKCKHCGESTHVILKGFQKLA